MVHRTASLNGILAGLPQSELDALLHVATYRTLQPGETILRQGEPYSSVIFPTSGILSAVGDLEDGQHVEIAAIGTDGMIGLGAVFGVNQMRVRLVVQLAATAVEIPADTFVRAFHASERLRGLTLAHAGRLLAEIARSASCNRFHGQRERLARWLLITMRKSGERILPLTHDFIAQMIGGPRHSVSAELGFLRELGAIDCQRGQIEILDDAKLLLAACECARHG
jgi:CRP-like cAMP-binding protein